MEIDTKIWDQLQEHMGYNEAELTAFKSKSKNCEIIAKGLATMNTEIICEVLAAKGCMCGHKKGDR